MFTGCRTSYFVVNYLYASLSRFITLVGEERAKFFCYCLLVTMWFLWPWDFLFLCVLGIGCIILLWHSLGRPYNYFEFFILAVLLTMRS